MTLDQIEDIYELSPLQQGFLFHTLYTPDTRAYFEQFVWTLRGELNIAAFERAWQQVVAHHQILRSSFHWQDLDNPVQAVHQEVTLPIALHDWRAVPDAEQTNQLEAYLSADRALGFDLEQPPLMRLALIQLDANVWYFVWSYHHLLLDGWSMSALLKDVFLAYEAARQNRAIALEPVRPYGDYIEWLQQQDQAATEAFWRSTLQGFTAPTPLIPSQPESTDAAADRYREQRFELPAHMTAALQTLARQHQITLSTIFQAAWALLLSRYSGEDDVVFGTTVSGRPADLIGFEAMIGLFINTLPLRVRLPADTTLLDWLKQLQAHQFDLRQYEHSSLVQVQGWSNVSRGLPLFESIVVFENFPLDRALPELSRSLEIEWARTVQHSNYPLTVMAIPAAELTVRIAYDRQRFDASTIERMSAHLKTILQSIADQPEQPLKQVALLTPAEAQLLLAWNATTASYPTHTPIHEQFAAQAARTPDAIALIFEDQALTYRELNQRANHLAHALQARGVGPDTPVAICAERSLELVVGLLGVWKAGGVCVPLDPDYPQERLRFMLADMHAPILLTQQSLVERLPIEHEQIILLDTDWQPSQDEPQSTVDGANLAYMIYTSGTTGTPKAVQVEHRNLANTMLAGQSAFGLAPGTIMPCIASFSFDIAFFELLSPLLLGGTTILVSKQQVLDLPGFAQILQQLTTLHTLPSLMRQIVDFAQARRQTYPAIRQVLVGGDLVPPDLVHDMYAVFPEAQIYVAYGPTETAILCSAYAVPIDQPMEKHLIGQPLPNTLLRIYDDQQRLVSIGVAGELYIGGAGVTRGYRNRPELSTEKFVTIDGERFYRSGDLARYQPDGTIEFLGRIDQQVKIRGFRIELGEIEAVLATHPDVHAAVVLAREEYGDKRLVAYVTEEPRTKNLEPRITEQSTDLSPSPAAANGYPLGEARLSAGKGSPKGGVRASQEGLPSSLRSFLAERLPEYMVPSAFVMLDALPLTTNGKVDRKALPAPETQRVEAAAYLAPQTAIEREIAQVWQEVLQLDRVGLHDNFFDLGGHSIRMMQAYGKLVERLDREIAMVDLFQYPTVAALAAHLSASPAATTDEIERPAFKALAPLADSDIAIIGMSGRFPGAPDVETFWQNLRDGQESISFFSDEELQAAGIAPEIFNHPDYVKAGAILQDIELFDAGFFGYSPREAAIMDPQHRIFLESVWEALEHAGYNPDSYAGPIGVFAGVGTNTYLLHNLYANQELLETFGGFQTMILNEKDHLTTRVSYKLNLRGPSINLQTACSTSLVATIVACQNLLLRQCDIALAGGVSISVPHVSGYRCQEGGVTSPDGHCRAFDAQGQGTISGNGVGVVVLKRLADALRDGDQIHAVIKGFALNNDGGQKVGYTAPGVDGQAEVIANALAMADIDPETISYVEAHGTATPLGDPIEIAALTRVFQQSQQPGWCAIGSVKTNVGHLDAASGVAGLIKTVMALEHGQIPPSLHFEQPNPLIDFASSPFAVNTALTEWPRADHPRRAGVSSFGIGGTNAHVVLEAAPPQPTPDPSRAWQILTLSARSDEALAEAAQRLAAHLRRHPELSLADVAYTLHVGRKAFKHRQMFVCRDLDEAIATLETQDPEKVQRSAQEQQDRPVVFMFPGQGAQYVAMAHDLYTEEPVFREQLDRCAELLLPHLNLDIRELLYPNDEHEADAARELSQTRITQPALFAVEYALAQLWIAWGVKPQAMLGHSLGEYVAATLAGVFSLQDALALVAQRGAMIQALPAGAMLSVSLRENELRPLLNSELDLAVVNAPGICVVAGPHAAIERLEAQLKQRGTDCRRVHTSHAFHSAMMDPLLDAFTEYVSSIALHPPAIPYLSNVTGTWITAEQATDPRYWTRHLRETVRFADNLQTVLAENPSSSPILLEVGPGRMLGTLARQHKLTNPAVLASLRHPHDQQSDAAFLLTTLGQLWLVGARLDWQRLYADEQRRRVVLPTYPFERQRYWIEPVAWSPTGARGATLPDASAESDPQTGAISELHPRPELLTPFIAPSTMIEQAIADAWQALLGVGPIGIHDNFFDLGGHSLMATQIIARLRDVFPIELPVSDIFDAATIAQLAAIVEAKLIEKLDDLSEEEARLLL